MLVTPMTASVDDLVRRGRITAALDRLTTFPNPSVVDLALTLECRLARGEMDLALRLGERLAAIGDVPADESARAAAALGELAAATGHDEDAVAYYRTAGALADDDPVQNPWRSGAALSLIRVSGRREAEQLARRHLELARDSHSPYTLAGALRTVAAVCLAVDRHGLLREARELVCGEYDRLAAQVATDLAGLLAFTATDHAAHQEAVTLLRSAEEYADHEDLWPLHTRVRRLLERLGETAQLPRSEAVARLSESELRIARLAATGGTNRSIADHLGITIKAVEWHLSHTYRKLGIRGRAELPRALRLPSP